MRLVISLRLDRHVFFHAEPQHQVLHALAAEDAHQVVLQREIEARAAGIALASGASAKLIVDAARFVALGAQDVQAAQRDHFIVLAVGLLLELAEELRPTRRVPASRRRLVCRQSGSLLCLRRRSLAMNSGLPPSRMSVPRPAMLVETVTAPLRPACATMNASRS